MFELIKNLFQDDRTFGASRSSRWPTIRKNHLAKNPYCEVCGSTKDLTVHHIQPFHLYPELELEPTNLITLCEGKTVNCHFLFGHFCNWKKFNIDVWKDAVLWNYKLRGLS